jgi:Holliday junction resolvasome RuvABC endonuclease subunit
MPGSKRQIEVLNHCLPKSKETDWWRKAIDIINQVDDWALDQGFDIDVAIEEPIYSWGRKNPKGFAKQNLFLGALLMKLKYCEKVFLVNPKSMKLYFAGNGNADKEDIIIRAQKTYNVSKEHLGNMKNREAISDAIGIAHVCWRHRLSGGIKGVTLLGS